MGVREATLRGKPVTVMVRQAAADVPLVVAPALRAALGRQVRQGQFDLMELPEHVQAAAALARRMKWRGHAAQPGTGPKGETCGGCEHRTFRLGGVRAYSKCGLAKGRWTHGSGSDIRLRDPACSRWQRKETAACDAG